MAIYTSRSEAERGSQEARTVLRYIDLVRHLVQRMNAPDHRADEWDALHDVVDVDRFQRIGNFMEVQDWTQYMAMMTQWASGTTHSAELRRMTAQPGLVLLELQENNGGHICNSVSVYELNEGGSQIHRLHIYLQLPHPDEAGGRPPHPARDGADRERGMVGAGGGT